MNTRVQYAALSREHIFLAFSSAMILVVVVLAEHLNHDHPRISAHLDFLAGMQSGAPSWSVGWWIYVAGYGLCVAPLVRREVWRATGVARRTFFGLAVQLLIGALIPAALRPCFQTALVTFAALVVGHTGRSWWRSGMVAGAGVLSLNAALIGQHDPSEALLGIGVGWVVFRLSFSSQLDFLDEPAPWRAVLHEITDLRRLWFANERADWEAAYASGQWDFLASLRQKPRHYLIAGIVRDYFPQGASVLDVGCGLAVLYTLIEDAAASYTGIDLAEAAIARCRSELGANPKCSFEQIAFEQYGGAQKFDVVILNEILYYFPLSSVEPIFQHAVSLLRDERSVLIVSLCKNTKARLVGRKLRRIAAAHQTIRVRNMFTGSHWTVSVYRRTDSGVSPTRRPEYETRKA